MRYTIAAQLVSHDLPRFSAMVTQQTPEKTLCRRPISLGLKVHINHFSMVED
jgi:hypothetical protein